MKIQHALPLLLALLATGCASTPTKQWAHFAEEPGPASTLRTLRSDHFELNTSLNDASRRRELITALEESYDAYCAFLEYVPPASAPRMQAYVFATAQEWARFTVQQTGEMSGVYLQTRRGGYTVGKLFVSRDAGANDTLTVAAHEGLHLFIATHFAARPPPFVEEGLACCFESVHRRDNGISIAVGENGARQRRLALAVDEKKLRPLKKLLSMHAGQVVHLTILDVETFYAQAWAFVRFLREGEGGKYRPAFMRLIADAQAGRLSSDDLADNPAMLERYLGEKLDTIQPAYDRFVESLAQKARIHASQ